MELANVLDQSTSDQFTYKKF